MSEPESTYGAPESTYDGPPHFDASMSNLRLAAMLASDSPDFRDSATQEGLRRMLVHWLLNHENMPKIELGSSVVNETPPKFTTSPEMLPE